MFDNNNSLSEQTQQLQEDGETLHLKEKHTNEKETETKEVPTNEVFVPWNEDFGDKLIIDREKRVWRIPWFILINCLLQIFLYIWANSSVCQQLMFVPALRVQFWRFLSYTLIHSDVTHLLLNICLQCLVGFSLECEQGHWKVVLIYSVSGVSGSLATLLLQPHLSLLGASAGIYGLLMSHVPHLLKNFSQLPHRYFRLVSLLVLWLSDAAFTAFHFLVNHNRNPRICLVAHAGGGGAGLLLGFLVYSSGKKTKRSGWSSGGGGRREEPELFHKDLSERPHIPR